MSNNQDNLETKLSDAKAVAGGMLSKGYWQPANDVWMRIGIIVALVIIALVCLALTHQGRAFKILLKDAAVELRRVTWPGKDETFQYTWQVIVVIGIVGFFIWLLDNFFNWFVGIFIG